MLVKKRKGVVSTFLKKFKSLDMYGKTIGLTYKGNE